MFYEFETHNCTSAPSLAGKPSRAIVCGQSNRSVVTMSPHLSASSLVKAINRTLAARSAKTITQPVRTNPPTSADASLVQATADKPPQGTTSLTSTPPGRRAQNQFSKQEGCHIALWTIERGKAEERRRSRRSLPKQPGIFLTCSAVLKTRVFLALCVIGSPVTRSPARTSRTAG